MAATVKTPPVDVLISSLFKVEEPCAKRMRVVYYLRSVAGQAEDKGAQAIEALATALRDHRNSPLMRHELAFVLGQIQSSLACDVLEETLADTSDDDMVRHESAEALGAIGDARSLPLLDRCAAETCKEVSETCVIAGDYVRWKLAGKASGDEEPMLCACMSPYNSVDPAPADPNHTSLSTEAVSALLTDHSLPLFDRYKAMFTLRNRGGDDAVRALGDALTADTTSPLFRHEVAYVLGQLGKN